MKWLRNLLNRPKLVDRPSHQEIRDKVEQIQQGTDPISVRADKQKEKYFKDLQKLERKAKIVQQEAEKMTTLAIAIVTGGISEENRDEWSTVS